MDSFRINLNNFDWMKFIRIHNSYTGPHSGSLNITITKNNIPSISILSTFPYSMKERSSTGYEYRRVLYIIIKTSLN